MLTINRQIDKIIFIDLIIPIYLYMIVITDNKYYHHGV